uniref:BMP family ABC transporter substrate-binding protein n=1 Tax=Streptomyces sp. NBC_00180 TaxID=2903632 RepID=A0AAU1IB74_9ACTN
MYRAVKFIIAVTVGVLGVTQITACDSSDSSAKNIKVGVVWGGRGDQSFSDSAAKGLDRAKNQLGITTEELTIPSTASEADYESLLEQPIQSGCDPIIAVGSQLANAVKVEAQKHPEIKFAIVDDSSVKLPNVTSLVFSEEQSSYLVGVAAALKSKSDIIGFIGGVDIPVIHKFEAGFAAGVKSVKPDNRVISKYLTKPPDFAGFISPELGKTAANDLLDAGADVIYSAAGGSGVGVIAAVNAHGGAWAIGVDSDQYQQSSLAPYRNVILTSALKNVDAAVFDYVKSVEDGKPLTGIQRFSLSNNGVGYATSGGFLDDATKQRIGKAKQDIISGTVNVPTE